jgi:hypothetical protein
MITESKFKTKLGWLTPYALVCGYQEKHEAGAVETSLWQECPAVKGYHVRQHDFEGGGRIFWEVFDNLPKARRFYSQACKKTEKSNNQHTI